MRAYNLRNVVVNLRSIGKVCTLMTYRDGVVYLRVDNKSGGSRSSDYYSVNLDSGFVQQAKAWQTGEPLKLTEYSDFVDFEASAQGWEIDVMQHEHGSRTYKIRRERIDVIVLQVLIALISYQVKGDELIKGLRLRGILIDAKLTQSYLGGWVCEVADRQIYMGTFIDGLIDELEASHRLAT